MSRSGYTDDCECLNLWRGNVDRAIAGKRGQKMLRDMKAALEAMPVRRLIAHDLECDGEVCALGALGQARGIDMSNLDPTEPEDVAAAFKIARPLAMEVVYMNDEYAEVLRRFNETPEERWTRMHAWVCEQIKPEPQP